MSPHPPGFSAEAASDALQRVAGDVRLARTPREAKPRFDEAEQLVLRALQLAARSWALLAPLDGQEQPARIVERASGGRNPIDRMTLGDWKKAYFQLPKDLAAEAAPLGPLFERHRRELKALKATDRLDAFVSVRNRLAHPGERSVTVSEVVDVVNSMSDLWRRLIDRQVLPIVLEPQEERRDRWGRLVLGALDGRGRTRDMVIHDSVDLTHPLVWIPRAVNPREVAPLFVSAHELDELVG